MVLGSVFVANFYLLSQSKFSLSEFFQAVDSFMHSILFRVPRNGDNEFC